MPRASEYTCPCHPTPHVLDSRRPGFLNRRGSCSSSPSQSTPRATIPHPPLLHAVRGASAEFRVFPHNHLAKVERLLADAPPGQLQVVLTESIFSMDGDVADLAGLIELKRRRPFILLLDEAHGSGVCGTGGA